MARHTIPGGATSVADTGSYQGVHAMYPAGTPKHNPSVRIGASETMARLYSDVPDSVFAEYRAFLPTEVRGFADVLRSGSSSGVGYVDFLLSQIAESHQEKVQVVEALTDDHVAYFFGARPVTVQFSGVLLNTEQDNWFSAFSVLYEYVVRGTVTATCSVPITLRYDDRHIIGSIQGVSYNYSAANEQGPTFSGQILAKEIRIVRTPNTGWVASAAEPPIVATATTHELSVGKSSVERAAQAAAVSAVLTATRPGADIAQLGTLFGLDIQGSLQAAAEDAQAAAPTRLSGVVMLDR